MNRIDKTILGNFNWTASKHGTKGYVTHGCASYDQTKIMFGLDVCNGGIRDVSGLEFTPLYNRDNIPAALRVFDGTIEGSYALAFAGQSNTRLYAAYSDRLLRSNDGAVTWNDTALTGKAVNANAGTRTIAGKIATDFDNIDVCVVGMGPNGTYQTLDGGTTFPKLAWLPDPIEYTLIALNRSSSMTGGGTSRRSQYAYGPQGAGVWISTDGGVTGSKIAGTGISGIGSAITSVSFMEWVGSTLWVVAADDAGDAFGVNGVYSWTVGGGWVNYVIDRTIRFLLKDPDNANGWWAVLASNDWLRTSDNWTSWTTWISGGANYILHQTKIRARPVVAAQYRANGGGYASARPFIAGTWIYLPMGFGVLRTPKASWPTLSAGYDVPHYSTRWPVWEEDCAGIEGLVGQSVCISRLSTPKNDVILGASQDVCITSFPQRNRGQRVTTKYTQATVTNGCSVIEGRTPGFLVEKHTKGEIGISYTLNAYDWVKCVNQPTIWNGFNDGGMCVAGELGAIYCFPLYNNAGVGRPQYTLDYGNTAWLPLIFQLEGGTPLDMTVSDTGFHGSAYYNQHHLAALDVTTGYLYAVNIGGSAAPSDTVNFGAGIYRYRPGIDAAGTFKRVFAGHPAPTGNYGYYDAKLLADGNGHLVFMPNQTAGESVANKTVIIDIATWTKRNIVNVFNSQSVAFGAPFPGYTQPALYMLAWGSSNPGVVAATYGVYILPDLDNEPSQGPFNHIQPGGGRIVYIDADKNTPGIIAAAIGSRGHSIGRLERLAA